MNSSCEAGVLAEFSREKEKESFSRDEILGSLEAQGTAGALSLPPPSFPPPALPVFPTSFTSSLASPSVLLSARVFFPPS